MITPKEKAAELVEKFYQCQIKELAKATVTPIEEVEHAIAKQSALIAVDEMLCLGSMVGSNLSDSFYIYWQEVKTEINNL